MTLRLKHKAHIINGFAFKSSDFTDGGTPIVRQSTLKNGALQLDNVSVPHNIIPSSFLLKEYDLCVGLSGSIENFAVVKSCDVPVALNQRVAAIRHVQDISCPRFLCYFVQSGVYRNHLGKELPSTTIANIDAKLVANSPFPNHCLKKQNAIADCLDRETARIDQLIEKKERLVEVLDEKSLTSSCGLADGSIIGTPASNRRSWFGSVPEGWKTRRAKLLFRESNRRSISGEEELLTVSHITGVTPRSEKQVFMFEAESNEGYKLVAPGDLVINTMWAWMGAMGVSRHEGLISPSYGVYSPTSCELLPDYMDVLVRTRQFVAEATRRSKGIHSSRLRLYPDAFLDMLLPVPPKDVQAQMLVALRSAVGRVEELKRLIGQSVERLREFRSALITAAVTDQINVATWGKRGNTDRQLDRIGQAMRA